ncbi:MAG: DUF1838 family protein [Halioglobus sp.]|nr:DUF1838 family protein [Halioglobus sp.]
MRFSKLLASCLAGLIGGLSAQATAGNIDPDTPEGYLKLNRKIQCSLEDNKPQVFQWFGRSYARVPGEPDKHLFNLEGMNIRQCVTIEDPERGKGFKLVSREIMLYLDPETGEVLRTFDNPWTGDSNEVIHVDNDPVNSKNFEIGRNGKPQAFELQDINGKYMMRF